MFGPQAPTTRLDDSFSSVGDLGRTSAMLNRISHKFRLVELA